MNTKKSNALNSDSKRMLPIYLMEILEEKSSVERPLKEADLRRLVGERYGIEVDSRTITNNMWLLQNHDRRINRNTRTRKAPGSNDERTKQEVTESWYCESYFEPSELRYLEDAIICNNRMSKRQRRDLFEKITRLGVKQRFTGAAELYNGDPEPLVNKQLFRTLDVLSEALNEGRCVRFTLGMRGLDGKLSRRPSDQEKMYIVEPVFLAVSNGFYYLVARFGAGESYAHFRIDLMLEIKICNNAQKGKLSTKRMSHSEINVEDYLEKHLYMYGGPSETIKFKIPANEPVARHQVFDHFGTSARMELMKNDPDNIMVIVTANPVAMRYWALQYSEIVEVISPDSLRKDLHKATCSLLEKYGQ